MHKKLFAASAVISYLTSFSAFASASGYSTATTSTSGLATSYAGSVNGIHDVSDMFFNPAILSENTKPQFIFSMTHLDLHTDVDGAGGSFSGGGKVSGAEVSDAAPNAQIPALYFSSPLSKDLAFGLAITSPFGLETKYKNNWAGRYHSIESAVETFNFNPALSYKINEDLSFGAGAQFQYYKATLTKAIAPYGDAIGKVRGNDWGYGYNLGLNYKVNDKVKLGIGYRSKIDQKLEGKSSVLNYSWDVTAKTTTPESLTAGIAFKVNGRLNLAYDTTWTRWSRVKSLIVSPVNTSNPSDRSDLNLHDSFLHSLGGDFQLNNKWLIRSGIAYEKSAVTDANRGTMIPNSDKIWTSIGLNYKINNDFSVDTTYLHQFFRAAQVRISDSTPTVNSLNAKYKTRVDLVSIAIKKEF